ncbi:hypothetical protein, partial [Photobacterium sanctipauli]|uniref:hypothetical protein n=1 Tax=Photobacterium sanctipauli TaxID=1342794 RepID=UPI001C1E1BCE
RKRLLFVFCPSLFVAYSWVISTIVNEIVLVGLLSKMRNIAGILRICGSGMLLSNTVHNLSKFCHDWG